MMYLSGTKNEPDGMLARASAGSSEHASSSLSLLAIACADEGPTCCSSRSSSKLLGEHTADPGEAVSPPMVMLSNCSCSA